MWSWVEVIEVLSTRGRLALEFEFKISIGPFNQWQSCDLEFEKKKSSYSTVYFPIGEVYNHAFASLMHGADESSGSKIL